MDFHCTSCNQLRSNNSETRKEFRKNLNIGSNNEGENPLISCEEIIHEQIENFESMEEIGNPKTNKNAKSPKELNSSERSIEFEKRSNAESHNEDENKPIIHEEMKKGRVPNRVKKSVFPKQLQGPRKRIVIIVQKLLNLKRCCVDI